MRTSGRSQIDRQKGSSLAAAWSTRSTKSVRVADRLPWWALLAACMAAVATPGSRVLLPAPVLLPTATPTVPLRPSAARIASARRSGLLPASLSAAAGSTAT